MSEYYAVVRSTDHLAHYGVKGMRWGVRKAIARADGRALDRHFRKAAKKLKKLQDIGLKPAKYAAKAAAYGVAAAGTGTLAIGGKKMAEDLLKNANKTVKSKTIGAGAVASFATKNRLTVRKGVRAGVKASLKDLSVDKFTVPSTKSFKRKALPKASSLRKIPEGFDAKVKKGLDFLQSDKAFRIGAGAAALGLGTASAVNAYRAKNASKYRQKAVDFKNAMDEAFAGTKYEGKYVREPRRKKRRSV